MNHINYILSLCFAEIIVPEFVKCVLITFLFFNQFAKNSFKIIVIVSFGVCVIIFGTIAMIWCAFFHSKMNANFPNNVVYLKFICKLLDSDKANELFRDLYCPVYASLYYVFLIVIYSPICLLFVSIINNIVAKYKTKSTLNEMEIELLSIDGSLESTNDSLPSQSSQFGFFCTLYFIFSILCWFIFGLAPYAVDIASIGYFACILILMSLFKFLFKRIARHKHDILTAAIDKHSENNSNWYEFVSFEIFIEFSFTGIYYWIYYISFILELSETNDINKYITIVFIHVFSETFQSTTRFSKLYFDLSSKFYLKLNEFNLNYSNKILNMFLTLTNDESTFMEWKIRHCIDMSMRFLAFMSITSAFLIAYWVLGYDFFGVSNKSESYRALLYFFITALIDIFYFLFLFLIHLYFFNYNVWKPFLLMYSSDYRVFVTVVFVCACFNAVLH